MRLGKLSSEELSELVISKTTSRRKEVLLSAGIAEDCAAIKNDNIIVITSDPITAAAKNSGKLAILISANDAASAGGEPFCCLLTIIAPPSATANDIAVIMNDAYETAHKYNIDIIGGHTEFSDSVNRTIISCTMLGRTDNLIKTKNAQIGDKIIVTKTIGIEATAIIAHDFEEQLLKGGLTQTELDYAKTFIEKISVIEDGKIASKSDINAMHDITEGGVWGAVTEFCEANNVGAKIYKKDIPIDAVTQKICDILKLDVYKIISSGSMIITTEKPEKLIDNFAKHGIKATVIGEIVKGNKVYADNKGDIKELSVSTETDELLKVKR